MNKIIAAFDGLKPIEPTADYAVYLSTLLKSHLTGVFLDDNSYTSYKIYDLVFDQGVSEKKLHQLKDSDNHKRKASANDFNQICKEKRLSFNIHHDKNIALSELLHESIFADLLILNKSTTFNHHEEKYPSRFLQDILSNAQCPVFLTPNEFKEFQKVIFLFDGKTSSVYALKMFAYLMSPHINMPIEVISVKPMEDNTHLPENKLLKELMKRHFSNINFTILKGIPEIEIIKHLQNESLSFVTVIGAYRRSMLSRWFRSSMADALVNSFEMPLFIAHNK
ncbi:MAG: universal stress protein [Sphingobacteriales bacterium]|nr:universal stress protein [Sphingobacteriales bacterium]